MQLNDKARLISVCLVISPLVTSCGRSPRAEVRRRTPEVTASTAVVQRRRLVPTVKAIGTVVTAPGASALLSSVVSARVERVFVAKGDQVRVGDALVSFERSIFDVEVRRAEAALRAATQARDRLQRLT